MPARYTVQQAAILKHLGAITVPQLMGVFFNRQPMPFTTRGIARAVSGTEEVSETRLKATRRTLKLMEDKGALGKLRIRSRYVQPGNLPKRLDAWVIADDYTPLTRFVLYGDWLLDVSKIKQSGKIAPMHFAAKGDGLKLDFMRYPLLNLLENNEAPSLEAWAPPLYRCVDKIPGDDGFFSYIKKTMGLSKAQARVIMKGASRADKKGSVT